MSNLSWFIYLAGIVDAIGGWASFFACVGGIVYLIFVLSMNAVIGSLDPDRDKGDLLEVRGIRRQVSYVAIPILAVCIPLAFFTPNRQTMILIAGSEIGQRAVNSQAAQDVINPGIDLLKTWIKRETEKLASEAKK